MASSKRRAPRKTRSERRAERPPPPPLVDALATPEALRDRPVVTTESLGLEPMSAVLEQFVAPVLETLGPHDYRSAVESAFRLGAMVWNAATPGTPARELLTVVEKIAAVTGRERAETVVTLLARRRVAVFGDDARVITDLKLAWRHEQLSIAVETFVPA